MNENSAGSGTGISETIFVSTYDAKGMKRTQKNPIVQRQLGKAVCAHYGLDPNQVQLDMQIIHGENEIFGFRITIIPTAQDMIGIGQQLARGE